MQQTTPRHFTHKTSTLHSHHSLINDSLMGLAGTLLSAILSLLLPDRMVFNMMAMLLPCFAAIYLGFAVSSHGHLKVWPQVLGMFLYLGISLWAMETRSWWILSLGIMSHGVWDVIHHHHEGVPEFYIPFCAVFDVSFGVWMLARYVFF